MGEAIITRRGGGGGKFSLGYCPISSSDINNIGGAAFDGAYTYAVYYDSGTRYARKYDTNGTYLLNSAFSTVTGWGYCFNKYGKAVVYPPSTSDFSTCTIQHWDENNTLIRTLSDLPISGLLYYSFKIIILKDGYFIAVLNTAHGTAANKKIHLYKVDTSGDIVANYSLGQKNIGAFSGSNQMDNFYTNHVFNDYSTLIFKTNQSSNYHFVAGIFLPNDCIGYYADERFAALGVGLQK